MNTYRTSRSDGPRNWDKRSVASLDPEDLERLRLLVKALYRQGRQEEATSSLNRANLVEVESHTMFDNLSRESIVLDIGGWKGHFTDYVLRRYGCEVHVVEPNVKFHQLEKARFEGKDRVHLYDCAIGGKTKRVRFYPSPDDYPAQEKGSSLLANSPYVDPNVYCEFQQYSLYDFVQLAKLKTIDLIKMDMEGAEFEVLLDPATQQVLDMCQSLTIEFHYRMQILDEPFVDKTLLDRAIQSLKDSGFNLVDFSRDFEFVDCLFYRQRPQDYEKRMVYPWRAESTMKSGRRHRAVISSR